MHGFDRCFEDTARNLKDRRLSRRAALIQGSAGLAAGALAAAGLTSVAHAQEASPEAAAHQATPARSSAMPPPFVATLEPKLLDMMQEMRIPGAIVLVDDPVQGAWRSALGSGNLATGEPMQLSNYTRIGSLTKTFTATAILQLVDQGLLHLDDPVSTYQPNVPNGANITIRHLLNMTSGIATYDDDADWIQAYLADPYAVWSPDDLVAVGCALPPVFAPGEGWSYSNTNTIILGMIVEQLTNELVADVFQRSIFQPLDMNQSHLPPGSSSAIPDSHAQGYMFGTEFDGTGPLLNATDWNPSWGWVAGSIVSTLDDIEIWVKALANGTLLSAATQEERLGWVDLGEPWLGKPFRYGLGLMDFGGFLGHSGVMFGYTAWMGHQPETGATIIVFTNLYLAEGKLPPAQTLAKAIQEELFT
jgi:D-alanyl-D-alanine carboxypeptidase